MNNDEFHTCIMYIIVLLQILLLFAVSENVVQNCAQICRLHRCGAKPSLLGQFFRNMYRCLKDLVVYFSIWCMF